MGGRDEVGRGCSPAGDGDGDDQRRRAAGVTRLVVEPRHSGLRLDQLLAATTGLSRRAARLLVGAGETALNQAPTRILSRRVTAGDVVDVLRPAAELAPLAEAPRFELCLLHDDRWLVVVDKPAGVLSQPAEEAPQATEPVDVQLLLELARREGRRPFLRLVHRLDRATSGTLLFARNPQALGPLTKAWREDRVERLYLAVVEGRPDFSSATLDGPIARDPGHRWRFRVDPRGRAATTDVKLLPTALTDASVILCRLRTGRTHQVRVHLANAGHPVLGDRLYGARPDQRAPRPLLHAARLSLPHPQTGRPLAIVAPPPSDFNAFLPPGFGLVF